MKHSKLFTILVFAITTLYAATGFYFLPLATFTGPLTRMGMIPESLFGWKKEQPAINPQNLINASWQDADVLVVGDSFSINRIWQSVLIRKGLKVRTETWASMRNICEDFSGWLNQQGFKGNNVVIEVVEHNFKNTLDRTLQCKKMDYHTTVELPIYPPSQLMKLNKTDYSGKLSVGIQTKLNSIKYQEISSNPVFASWDLSNNVRMSRVKKGCELFSHLRCNDALFLADDQVTDFDETTLSKMQIINDRLNGIRLIWAVIPNKSTAYLYPDKQFWNKAEKHFNAPNVLKVLRQKIADKTIDLYPANETHLSTTGYLILGDAISQNIIE